MQTGYPLTLHFGPHGAGGNLPGVDLPADPLSPFTADACQVFNITLNTGRSRPATTTRLL
jgi:hypothetical protein